MNLLRLPPFVLMHTFTFLPPEEVGKLSFTCKLLHNASKKYFTNLGYLSLVKIPRMTSNHSYQVMQKVSSNLQSLKIDVSNMVVSDLGQIPSSITFLKIMGIYRDFVLSQELYETLSMFRNLRTLKYKFPFDKLLDEFSEEELTSLALNTSEATGLTPFVDYEYGLIKFCDLKNDPNIARQELQSSVKQIPIFRMNLRKPDCNIKLAHISLNPNTTEMAVSFLPRVDIYQLIRLQNETLSNDPEGKPSLVITVTGKKRLQIHFGWDLPCSCQELSDKDMIEFAVLCRRVKEIGYSKVEYVPNGFITSVFAIFPQIKGISFRESSIKKDNLIELSEIKNLKNIRFMKTKFERNGNDLEMLFTSCQLNELGLTGGNLKLTLNAFSSLCSIRTLIKLTLNNRSINDRYMTHIPDLINLTHLIFHGCTGVTSKGYRPISELLNLNHLEICYYKGLEAGDLNYILNAIGYHLDTIRIIEVIINGLEQAMNNIVDKCTSLRYLDFPLAQAQAYSYVGNFKSLLKFNAKKGVSINVPQKRRFN